MNVMCSSRKLWPSRVVDLLVGLIIFSGASLAHATTWTVGSTGASAGTCSPDQSPDPTCTLITAIASAGSGDTIVFSTDVQLQSQTTPIIGHFTIVINPLTIDGSPNGVTLDGNQANSLFIISSGANVTLNYLTVQNGAGFDGGGIQNIGTLTIANSVIRNNTAVYGGGGILNQGLLTISASTISGNSASNSFGGGGIYNGGTLFIDHSTIDNNVAGTGGGIANLATATISNCTIAHDTATAGGFGGGGVYNASQGALTISNSTLAYNTASGQGGGIYTAGVNGFLYSYSNIIANNTSSSSAYDDIYYDSGTLLSIGNNLIGNGGNSGVANTNGDQVGSTGDLKDPGFAVAGLADNGGPTQTIALQSGSLALGAGECSGNGNNPIIPPISTDQRNYSRPTTLCDVGALEETLFRSGFE